MTNTVTYWDAESNGYRRIIPLSIRHDGADWLMLAHDTVNKSPIEVKMASMTSVVGKPSIELGLVK